METSRKPNTTSWTQPDTSKESIENPTVNFLGKKIMLPVHAASRQAIFQLRRRLFRRQRKLQGAAVHAVSLANRLKWTHSGCRLCKGSLPFLLCRHLQRRKWKTRSCRMRSQHQFLQCGCHCQCRFSVAKSQALLSSCHILRSPLVWASFRCFAAAHHGHRLLLRHSANPAQPCPAPKMVWPSGVFYSFALFQCKPRAVFFLQLPRKSSACAKARFELHRGVLVDKGAARLELSCSWRGVRKPQIG